VAQTGQFFDRLHRPGNVHNSNGAAEFMRACFTEARAVLKNTIFESRLDSAFFNEEVLSGYNRHGVQFSASRLAVPFERFPALKGRAENSVGYVKKNLLAGLQIPDFAAIGPAAKHWLETIANVRIHGETRQKPVELFEQERSSLLRLPVHFMESRVLLSAAELNLFTLLAGQSWTSKQLSAKLNADPRGMTILLDALAAMGLISKREDIYHTIPDVGQYLVDHTPRSVLPMILHAAHLWEIWSDLTGIVRKAVPSKRYLTWDSDKMRAFVEAMHVLGAPLAEKIAVAVQPRKAAKLIDVGGASGTYTIAFLKAAPGMMATLFDRPEVISIARERISAEGMLDRVQLQRS
jgi:hypothetical protein